MSITKNSAESYWKGGRDKKSGDKIAGWGVYGKFYLYDSYDNRIRIDKQSEFQFHCFFCEIEEGGEMKKWHVEEFQLPFFSNSDWEVQTGYGWGR